MDGVNINIIEKLDDGCLKLALTKVSYVGEDHVSSKIVPVGGAAIVLENNIARDIYDFATATLRVVVNFDTHVEWYIGKDKTTICPKEFYLNNGLVY